MLPVADRPLLENTISVLVNHGFRRFFITICYLGEQIEAHFGDGRRFGCDITYLREERPLGTAGALSMLSEMPSDPLLVLNGDLLTDLDFSALMDFHTEAGCDVTQCVREYDFEIPYGVVHCENGRVLKLEEKPLQRFLINAGIYILSPHLLELIPRDQSFTMPELISQALCKDYNVTAFPVHERWADIGHPEDYHWARHNWAVEESG